MRDSPLSSLVAGYTDFADFAPSYISSYISAVDRRRHRKVPICSFYRLIDTSVGTSVRIYGTSIWCSTDAIAITDSRYSTVDRCPTLWFPCNFCFETKFVNSAFNSLIPPASYSKGEGENRYRRREARLLFCPFASSSLPLPLQPGHSPFEQHLLSALLGHPSPSAPTSIHIWFAPPQPVSSQIDLATSSDLVDVCIPIGDAIAILSAQLL